MSRKTIRRAAVALVVAAAAGCLPAPPAQAQSPGEGPGGPVLVAVDPGDEFGRYYAEILRAEGLNEFAVASVGTISAQTLAAYRVVVLAETALSDAQVAALDSWVQGGGTPPPSGDDGTPDVTAPKVILLGRSVRVSASGIAPVRVRCPRSEVSYSVALKLKLGGKRIARGTLTLSGGTRRAVSLRLSRAARAALAARSRLKVTAVVTARDEAGNQGTIKRRMTLRAPAL